MNREVTAWLWIKLRLSSTRSRGSVSDMRCTSICRRGCKLETSARLKSCYPMPHGGGTLVQRFATGVRTSRRMVRRRQRSRDQSGGSVCSGEGTPVSGGSGGEGNFRDRGLHNITQSPDLILNRVDLRNRS